MHFKHYKCSYSALFYITKAITQPHACVLGDLDVGQNLLLQLVKPHMKKKKKKPSIFQ